MPTKNSSTSAGWRGHGFDGRCRHGRHGRRCGTESRTGGAPGRGHGSKHRHSGERPRPARPEFPDQRNVRRPQARRLRHDQCHHPDRRPGRNWPRRKSWWRTSPRSGSSSARSTCGSTRSARPETLFAANTSAIPITRIGACHATAGRGAGMHFMNPVPLKPMVEVIRGYHTPRRPSHRAGASCGRWARSCILVNDSPGFVSNRVLMLTVNEAVYLVQERRRHRRAGRRGLQDLLRPPDGAARDRRPDRARHHPLLDRGAVRELQRQQIPPLPAAEQMVDAGLHGRKTGRASTTYNRLTAEA